MKHGIPSLVIVAVLGLGILLALSGSAQATLSQHTSSPPLPAGGSGSPGPLTPTSLQAAVISRTYTLDADFALGASVNVTYTVVHDQAQLVTQMTTFPFIWIPASARGTVIKIDTTTGQILGEYRTAPDGRYKNPSRTTVDMKGNVWVSNRDEATNGLGSVIHIGLKENSQCVDRNGNGVIDTSTGLGDIKAWPNATGVNTNGGVSAAADECIIHYVRVPGTYARHISVDKNNNVWVGGYGVKKFSLLDGATGAVLRTVGPFSDCGGYGGLVDSKGVVWSANYNGRPLRFDPATGVGACLNIPSTNYGMSLDSLGYIWLASYSDSRIYKLNPDGTTVAGYPKASGSNGPRGVAVDANDQVWIAHSGSNTLVRMNSNGVVQATIPVCTVPIGVAVDKLGKIWVPCQSSSNAVRVNPATNLVDLTVALGTNAGAYTYSDMTGIIALSRTDPQGSWTVIYDSGKAGTPWGTVSWNSSTPSGSSLAVRARSAETPAGLGAATYISVTNGVDLDPPNGRYLQVEVVFRPGTGSVSPLLYDLTIQAAPPPCVMTNDKIAVPNVTVAGGAVTVILSMQAVGTCDAAGSPADVMLVLDRSGSMGGEKITKAKQSAIAFAGLMNLSVDQVGVASFSTTGQSRLDLPLSQTAVSVTAAINALVATGNTNIKEGLERAETELGSARRRAASAPVIILLSDGQHNETTSGELLTAATRIKRKGIRIISIGLGADADANQLRAIASLASDYYYAPDANALMGIYQNIAPTMRVAGRSMVITDTLSSFVTLVPNTFQGPVIPTVSGNQIIWEIAAVPASPITLTYQVALTSMAGNWPTNDSAMATYLDSTGAPASMTFPKPYVTVPKLCEAPVVKDMRPIWGCVAQDNAVSIGGSSFFTLTDWTSITGTFSMRALIGPQPLTVLNYGGSWISATLAANALTPGKYDVTVINTCALTGTPPLGGSSPVTPTAPTLPPAQVLTGKLINGFTLYAAPKVLSIKPPEGYGDLPADITICGEGFTPESEAFIISGTTSISLENQAAYGDTCRAGTVPAGLTPGVHQVVVRGPCGEASGEYRVLNPAINDDLWALKNDLWFDPSLCPNTTDDIKLGLTVSRRGGKDPLQSVVVRFYEDSQDTAKKIGDGTLPLLPPRANPSERIPGWSTSAVEWTPSRGAGQYTIWAVIDPDSQVVEDIETNNVVSRTIQVLPATAGRDQVAPHVDELRLNNWSETITDTTVYTSLIHLDVKATDYAQVGVAPSGVASMDFVEYLFNSAVGKWVPVGSSGWISFTPGVTVTKTYPWRLTPVGGLRVIQAWAADAAGKISRYPSWKTVNYAASCTSISRDGKHVYRQALKMGDTLSVEMVACSGDPDLYIWPANWQAGNAPYVSNQTGTATEFLEIKNVAAAGVYQIEVYGYTNAQYSLQIEVEPASSLAGLEPQSSVRTAGVALDKTPPTDPALPADSLPSIMQGVPPDVPAPTIDTWKIYLPLIVRGS